MKQPNLASELSALPLGQTDGPVPDQEFFKGWGVFGLPFDSGHVLALRVATETSFGPYRTLWHRDPQGNWSIYVDGSATETACPRYYGSACSTVAFADIKVEWTGPASLRISMPDPALSWTLTTHESLVLRILNSVSRRLPLSSWRPRRLRRLRELAARGLGMGRLEMRGRMPSGHIGGLMPARMYYVDESSATLNGTDLGRPAHVKPNPEIGNVALPARGVLAIGQAMFGVLDKAEFEHSKALAVPVSVPAGLHCGGPTHIGRAR